jgi:hypothetical protein
MNGKVIKNETLLAIVVALVIVMAYIMTSDYAPIWIYQGF